MMHLVFVFLALVFQSSVSELTATLRTTTINTPTTLSLELKNTNPVQVAILRWNLPLDKSFGGEDAFQVFLDNQVVPYIGAKVKYADPSFLDYLILNPNETISVPVFLHNLYDFTKPGVYQVQFQYYVMDFVYELDFSSIPRLRKNFSPSETITSNYLTIEISVPYPKKVVAPYPCSTSEQNTITSAASSLKSQLITRAQTVINQGDSSTYLEWFGAYTTARWQTAGNVISKIRLNSVVAYQCDNTANVYAYVYPSDRTHTIYVCSAFWRSKNIGGFDTQAGTLLHELSHFSDIGATSDHTYGTTNCRNLARTNPARAVSNADNFEYFAESQFP